MCNFRIAFEKMSVGSPSSKGRERVEVGVREGRGRGERG
jgi:hypothetical protein